MREKHEIIIDGEGFSVEVDVIDGVWEATVEGRTYRIELPDAPSTQPIRRRGVGGRKRSGTVSTNIPGKVVTVEVGEGDVVEEGQVILILEAMKMQNEVLAPLSGTVTNVNCSDGENVEANVPLVVIEPDATED